MNHDDPLDRLRRANPVPEGEAPGPESQAARAAFERIVASPSPEPDRQRRRRASSRRAWVLIPAVAIVAAAAAYAVFQHVSQPLVVVCYGSPNLNTSRAEVQALPADATSACGALWRPGAELNPRGGPVPKLEACVLSTGGVGVFPAAPGQDVCSALGLEHPDMGDRGESEPVLRAQQELSERFLTACIGPQDAARIIRSTLVREGLDDWHVSAPSAFPVGEPCASVGFDVAHKVVNAIPVSSPP